MKQSEYIKGATKISQIPDELPIILFLGRSNVGKSSLINSLTNRKNLAHTSGIPGKTLLLNFYLINKSYYFVDAPGYGYAKRSKKMQDEFIVMIEEILMKHPKIIKVILVIDFKIGPTKDDLSTYEFLKSLNLDIIMVATKKDKINKSKQLSHENKLRKSLDNPDNLYVISNLYKDNIESLQNIIAEGVEKYESS